MIYRVVFSPEAEEQLAALFRYIAAAASPDIAARYTEAIVTYCESLHIFPHQRHRSSPWPSARAAVPLSCHPYQSVERVHQGVCQSTQI